MNKILYDKLLKIKLKYDKGIKELSNPLILSNIKKYNEISKKINSLKEIVNLFEKWLFNKKQILEWREIFKIDLDLKESSKKEIRKLKISSEKIIKKIQKLFELEKEEVFGNTIIEIRSAAGGAESELFAKELCEAYLKTMKKLKFKTEILSSNESSSGGYSIVSFLIKNKKIYNQMQFEAGVHRVQRIPKTETQGRVHTSTITVAVLKERTETEVKILPEDIRIDTFRSSGAGGQHVNTTNSAIRITHIKTGIVVSCQDGRSQHDNKDKALKVLRSRLFDFYESKSNKEFSEFRSKQIGLGMRSEKIRTYNFSQNRVTDHRIQFSVKNIEKIMQGDFKIFWDLLKDWKIEKDLKNEK